VISLDGRVAIVTGGSRGIGLATVESLAASGANVIIVSRSNNASFAALAKRLSEEFNVGIDTIFGDVGDPSTATSAVQFAFKKYKRLDVLVNNAGILDDALIGMISEESIDNTLNTNVKGVINFTQAAARLMERSGGGSIINVASIIGRYGNRGQVVYGASKAAVIGATLSSSKELAGKNIRVNAVAPGYIATDMIKNIDPAIDAIRRASIGMGRVGLPQDVANANLFLASDLSSYITGQTIGVDGAMLV
jgi:3-oxoacyl-[acyl-carrier protein] reductase